MANCPNCGSSHIQIKRETNVSWGRAAAGWALFGVAGGAVGAITGEDRNVNACLDCGTSWKAKDLYNTLQIIKASTGTDLDLAREQDRFYMNSFMSEVGFYLTAISEEEKRAKKLLADAQSKSNEKAAAGCSFGCVTSLVGFFTLVGVASASGFLWLLIFPPIIGIYLGSLADKTEKRSVEREIERKKMEADRILFQAEDTFKQKVMEFVRKHPL
ncbi:hypothetical protein IQ250_05590 [Pseudanabaenaceae cyanobacterium LEGE 13415]|nr:hypothetical protein [Pseudanabaenaceae cyanobacterium LEGE 13415]